jgi:hypothetical protein
VRTRYSPGDKRLRVGRLRQPGEIDEVNTHRLDQLSDMLSLASNFRVRQRPVTADFSLRGLDGYYVTMSKPERSIECRVDC